MEEINESFKIDNDKTADWAISVIRDTELECERLVHLAEEQINDLNEKIDTLKTKCTNDTKYLKSCLAMYFNTVKSKETKTQKTYKLLSGTLVFKKPSIKIIHDDEKLINALDGTEYVETKKSFKWSDYKKNLSVEGNNVIDITTGEIIDSCSIEEVPASFNIKF